MSENGRQLAEDYRAALEKYLAGAGEAALSEAYDLGRKAISHRLGVVQFAAVHHESLAGILLRLHTPAESARTARNAAIVQGESLSVFEMALRGYQEANNKLTALNKDLEQQAAELQRAHDELKKTEAHLVQSAKLAALGQLVAGVAHEINNPLAFVLNNTVILQRDAQALADVLRLFQQAEDLVAQHRPELFQQIRDLADRIDLPYTLESFNKMLARSREGLKRIQQIVQDLRDFARPDLGTFAEVSDLNAGIAFTLSIVRGEALKQGVTLEADLAPLPPLTCSPAKINQVVLNLVANAIEACSQGGRVDVRTRPAPGGIEIHVSDTGSGIDPAIRHRVFDPFFTSKPPGKGTGLGLSISHGIIEEHGGRIDVESAPGRGTHFVVFLPLRGGGGL